MARSPPPPAHKMRTNNDSGSSVEKKEINNTAEAILTTDLKKVKKDPSLIEMAKSSILQSISIVESLHDENILSKILLKSRRP